jgi:hypothetical protein
MRLGSASTASTVSPATAVLAAHLGLAAQPALPQQTRQPLAQRRDVIDRGGGERIAVEDHGHPRRARVHERLRGARRLLLGPDHRGHPRLARHEILQAGERSRIARRRDVDLGGGDDPGRKPARSLLRRGAPADGGRTAAPRRARAAPARA